MRENGHKGNWYNCHMAMLLIAIGSRGKRLDAGIGYQDGGAEGKRSQFGLLLLFHPPFHALAHRFQLWQKGADFGC